MTAPTGKKTSELALTAEPLALDDEVGFTNVSNGESEKATVETVATALGLALLDDPTLTGNIVHDGANTYLERTDGGGVYLRMKSDTANYIAFNDEDDVTQFYIDVSTGTGLFRIRDSSGDVFFQYNEATGATTFPNGGLTASQIGLVDTLGLLDATDVEAALAEMMTLIEAGGGGGGGGATSLGDLDDITLDAVTDGQALVYDTGTSTFVNTTLPGGGDMLGSNNLSDVGNAATARANLDLGTAAVADTENFATDAQGLAADTALQNVEDDTSPTLGGNLADGGFTIAGRDLEADGAKLDLIEAGAEANSVNTVNGYEGDVVLVATDVEAVSNKDGGAALIYEITNASGATGLNLAEGNVQWISSTSGNYTLSISGGVAGRDRSFTLFIDTSTTGHTPTWFNDIEWIGGTPVITWTGSTRHIFFFQSIDGTNWTGIHVTAPVAIDTVTFSAAGTLTAGARAFRLYNDSGQDRTIVSIRASVGTAPTGASILVDVNKGGTTLFTTQGDRPTIAVSTNTDAAVPNVTSWGDGTYLTVDIDQIGSTIAGADLTVTVNYRQGS